MSEWSERFDRQIKEMSEERILEIRTMTTSEMIKNVRCGELYVWMNADRRRLSKASNQ